LPQEPLLEKLAYLEEFSVLPEPNQKQLPLHRREVRWNPLSASLDLPAAGTEAIWFHPA
jgi:hypothetical protein